MQKRTKRTNSSTERKMRIKRRRKKHLNAREFSICRKRKWANTHSVKNISNSCYLFCHIVVGASLLDLIAVGFVGAFGPFHVKVFFFVDNFSLIFRLCVCRFFLLFLILFSASSRKIFLRIHLPTPSGTCIYDAEDKGHFYHTTTHMCIKHTRPMIYV